MPSRTAGGSGTTYTAEDQANELLGEQVMPPPSIASGYAPLPAAPVQQAPPPQQYATEPQGGNDAYYAPDSPDPNAGGRVYDATATATPYQAAPSPTVTEPVGTPAPTVMNTGPLINNPAREFATPPPSAAPSPAFDPTWTDYRSQMRRGEENAYRADMMQQEAPAPSVVDNYNPRNPWTPPPPASPEPQSNWWDYIVPAAAAADAPADAANLLTPYVQPVPASRPIPAPPGYRWSNDNGNLRALPGEANFDAALAATLPIREPASDIMRLPVAPSPTVVDPSRAPAYGQTSPINADSAGLNVPLGGSYSPNPFGGAADMTQAELDMLGGVASYPNATTLNYEVARRDAANAEIARQREVANAQNDPLIAAAIAQSDAGIQDAPPEPTVMGMTTAAQQQADAWNRFDPFNQTRRAGDSIGVPPRTEVGTVGQVGTASPATPAPTTLAGNVPAKTILNPDGQLVARDAAFSSGELFPDDTFTAADGTTAKMGTFWVQDDDSGMLIPVTPAPGTTQSIKDKGGDIWQLDDTEFSTLVDAGLADEADREAMIGKPIAIPKEWVDALGGNVTYEEVAANGPVDTSGGSGVSSSNSGYSNRSYGSRSSYGGRSYGGGGYGGGRSYSGGGGGGGYGGGAGGGVSNDIAAFFGPDFMGGRFAAEGNGREGTPFESSIFDRYFATTDGKRMMRRRRGRRGTMPTRRGAQMPDSNMTIRRGGGDTASSNLDRARQLQER